MKFEKKLKAYSQRDVWNEYCGFLSLSLDEYMDIQFRLLQEEISLLGQCGLGQKLFGGKTPETVEEFRRQVPLSTYEDYADILLLKREDMLPRPPVVWLETTWESGAKPTKVAPYSQEMLQTYQNNILAGLILSTSDQKGKFHVQAGDKTLYGLAPLPYATGLFPLLIDSEINLHFMPSLKEAQKLSFSQQSKSGFQQGMKKGIDLFFGMSSVLYCITKNFQLGSGTSLKNLTGMTPKMALRILRALYRCKRDGTTLKPKDIFQIRGFVCVGTDTELYKAELEEFWGRRPLEVTGGTEPSCIGTETWSRDGLVFFPDACFYEFIPEPEMLRSLREPSYQPRTYLMNELVANQNYELVLTVLHGGAFARYRVGDVYRCIRLTNREDGLDLPQFQYVDRVPNVIDISGFTRITQRSIQKVIDLSRLEIAHWFALKEYDAANRSFLHLYVEMDAHALQQEAVTRQIILEHLGVYFRYYDHDYKDLKRLLGVDPLRVTMLPSGAVEQYERAFGKPIETINPPKEHVIEMLRLAGLTGYGKGDVSCR